MTSYKEIPIPATLAARLQETQRLPGLPATLGEFVGMPGGRPAAITPATLYCDSSGDCCGEHSRHEITVDGITRATHCVLDTLLLAIHDDDENAWVRSFSPLSHEVVTLSIT